MTSIFIVAQVSATIRDHCEEKWRTNYEMQEYCIKNQTEAAAEIAEFIEQYDLDFEGTPKDNDDLEPAEVIFITCMSKWEKNYEMAAYCIENQADAARRLGKLSEPRKTAGTGSAGDGRFSVQSSQVKEPPPTDMALRAEQLLFQLGFMKEEPDGLVRGNTVSAVIDYQIQNGLEMTGDIDKALIAHMESKVHE